MITQVILIVCIIVHMYWLLLVAHDCGYAESSFISESSNEKCTICLRLL